MNINTKSWHYRLIKTISFRDSQRGIVPTSLCPYMRAVMYRVLFLAIVIIGVTTLLGVMGNPIGITLMASLGISGLAGTIGAAVAGFFAMVAILAAVIGVAVGGGIGIAAIATKVGEIRRERKWARLEKEIEDRANGIIPPEPGLFKAWFSAKHDAICPTLTFVKPEASKKGE